MVRSELENEDHHKGRRKDKDRRERDLDRDDEEPWRDKDRDRTRDRDKVRDYRDNNKERDRDRDREKEKERDRERDSHERERGRQGDRDRDREKEKERDREWDAHERERDRDKKDREGDKEKDRDRDKLRDRDRDADREKYREKEKAKDRERAEKERTKDRDRDREKEKDKDRERESTRDREKERERDRDREILKDRERDKDREREKNKEKEASKAKDREKDDKKKERGKDYDVDRERDIDYGKERRKDRDKRERDMEKEKDKDREREREKEKMKDREYDNRALERDLEREREPEKAKELEKDRNMENEKEMTKPRESGDRLEKMEEEGHQEKASQDSKKGKSDIGSEIANWVNRSRKLEDQKKLEERIKAARMARMLAEQDTGKGSDSDDENRVAHTGKDLAGFKVLHGIDKVMEGGAVVLTLKDRDILAGDDVNDEVDELENLEIAQQRARDEAYKSAKKNAGMYEDKFQNDINAVRTILPQYDEEMKEAGMVLDETGGFSEESRKRLEELKLKLQGVGERAHVSLGGTGSVASEYYTPEEMLQFNKPKKKKKLRKKEVLDIDALEAEAKAEGLGSGDLGSRASGARRAAKQEEEKAAEEARKTAYMNAYSKAVDASKVLQLQTYVQKMDLDTEDSVVFGAEEDDELERSLERARKAALKKQAEDGGFSTGPHSVVSAIKQLNEQESEKGSADDASEKDKGMVVFTETEEFCRSLQLDEVIMKRPSANDVFGAEDNENPVEEHPNLDGGWMEVKEEAVVDEIQKHEEKDDAEVDEPIKEVCVGKGLAGALQLLKERGSLKETVEWGGRNMDKKKSKLVGIVDQEEKFRNREILLDRVDEFGRTMTPKEAFRKLSHKFHGKGPGKSKQEKRMKQYQEELKLKQMNSGDTPLMSMEKMREAQAKMNLPYIVISGHIKPGQTSDPRSGFATVEKEFIGSLTPMLGDKKVEHFLGIKRKPEGGSMGPPPPKKPKADSQIPNT